MKVVLRRNEMHKYSGIIVTIMIIVVLIILGDMYLADKTIRGVLHCEKPDANSNIICTLEEGWHG
jgi:hypothetical protein